MRQIRQRCILFWPTTHVVLRLRLGYNIYPFYYCNFGTKRDTTASKRPFPFAHGRSANFLRLSCANTMNIKLWLLFKSQSSETVCLNIPVMQESWCSLKQLNREFRRAVPVSSCWRNHVTTNQSPSSTPSSPPEPCHLPCTPWLQLWFALGSVAVAWGVAVPQEKNKNK